MLDEKIPIEDYTNLFSGSRVGWIDDWSRNRCTKSVKSKLVDALMRPGLFWLVHCGRWVVATKFATMTAIDGSVTRGQVMAGLAATDQVTRSRAIKMGTALMGTIPMETVIVVRIVDTANQ